MDEIKRILVRIRPDSDFEASRDFVKDQCLDSLDIVEVVMSLEQQFKIEIPESRITPDNFASFAALEKLVRELS